MVQPSTITKCFKKCGISDIKLTAEPEVEENQDDEFSELLDGITLNKFAAFDNNIQTTVVNEDKWEEKQLAANEPPAKLSPIEVSEYLEKLKCYALQNGNDQFVLHLCELVQSRSTGRS